MATKQMIENNKQNIYTKVHEIILLCFSEKCFPRQQAMTVTTLNGFFSCVEFDT